VRGGRCRRLPSDAGAWAVGRRRFPARSLPIPLPLPAVAGRGGDGGGCNAASTRPRSGRRRWQAARSR
jgi:hypothetical protein